MFLRSKRTVEARNVSREEIRAHVMVPSQATRGTCELRNGGSVRGHVGRVDILQAVSYTHLDVYKRQE